VEDDPLEKISRSPKQWIDVHDHLVSMLELLPHSEWKPPLPMPRTKDPSEDDRRLVREELFRLYKPEVPATITAIARFFIAMQWPELTPPQAYYLRLNLEHSIDFVRKLFVGRRGSESTIFQFPGDDPAPVVLWLLTNWWVDHGLREVVVAATSDEALFYRYFA
jgi:hypothetical protein